jgi:hypothetical protein
MLKYIFFLICFNLSWLHAVPYYIPYENIQVRKDGIYCRLYDGFRPAINIAYHRPGLYKAEVFLYCPGCGELLDKNGMCPEGCPPFCPVNPLFK